MTKVLTHMCMSLDGFVAQPDDNPAELFDWYWSGDVTVPSAQDTMSFSVDAASAAMLQELISGCGALIAGRRLFDQTDGWGDNHPVGAPVVVVTHRGRPEGWYPEAPFYFVDGIEAAMAKAQELAGDRVVEVAAGDVGSQVLAAGLIDEVRMDVVPVVFGSGKRYFGSVHAQHLLEDPDEAIQGNRVLHLRYRVRH